MSQHGVLEDSAKQKYEKDEKKRKKAKEQGEGTWMLSSVSDRIEHEQKSHEKHKKHKKDKKKQKKLKKEKKKKKEKVQDSGSSSSSEDSNSESEWSEKVTSFSVQPPTSRSETNDKDKQNVKGPVLQRDSWMEAPMDLIPTVNSKDIREQRLAERKQKKAEPETLPGQHEKELNPYWKDGGTGLPESKPAKRTDAKACQGDGGLSWLRKSYGRCKQQAEEEGRSMEEVAAERWGSLKELERKLAEAEKFAESQRHEKSEYRDRKRVFRRPDEDSDEESNKQKDSYYYRKSDSHRTSKNSQSKRDSYISCSSRYSRSRSRSREKDTKHHSRRYHSRSRSRSRSRDRSTKYRSRSRSPHRKYEKDRNTYERRSRSRSRDRKTQKEEKYKHTGNSTRESFKSKFTKPSDTDNLREYTSTEQRDSKNYVPAWKKKTFLKPNDETVDRVNHSPRDRPEVSATWKKQKAITSSAKEDQEKRRRSVSDSSGSSESSVSSTSSESDSDSSEDEPPPPKVIKVLTEQEMNALGAKILRAEMMGDEEMAQKLKSELEAAQKAKSEAPSVPVQAESKTKDKDGDMVVLTKTGRSGMVKPVDVSEHTKEGRRRKKQKVATHEGKGERVKYFDDDDKFDLKQLVEREKLGSAEDQNMMFSRLANRETDRDLDIDDMFVNKAAHKQSETQIDNRERLKAIEEHHKVSRAMDNCTFCFEKVPKHLIISIGSKVYLCLPNHRSLTDGHCLIVPMQHVSAGTMVEEDVWEEMQTFRKCLTQMFEKRDLDVVFMETSMNLRKFPHACIECVPMEKEVGDLAPIYFKKAIQECEKEWADNKKLVDLSKKDIRRSVPKGFPYFSVDFGLQGGFAHVIEDERQFANYFGREIIGGMIDAEPRLWRKPLKENFEEQRKKVLEFSEWFKPYDWTQNLTSDN